MNTLLQTNIYNQLIRAVSGTTQEVHFMFLPDEKLLKKVTVVYEVNNTSNDDCFDSKEALKFYSLKVRINAPQSTLFGNLSIYIKENIYSLTKLDSKTKNIKLVTEEVFYDNELKIFTEYFSFEIQCT